MTAFQKRLILSLFILALLSPIGIILPEVFNAGDAWGEWGLDRIKEMIGFIPEGMRRLSDLWRAPAPDYNFGGEDASLIVQVVYYVVSGMVGGLLVIGIIFIFTKISKKKVKN